MDGEIHFTVNGIKEALNQPHKYITAKNEAIKEIKNRIKNGKYMEFALDRKGNEMIKGYHYIETPIANDKSNIVVRELKTGEKLFYSITDKKSSD